MISLKRGDKIPSRKTVKKDYFKTIFIIFLLLLVLLSFLVVKPFVNAILAGIIIAYIFYPVYKWINARIKSENICAFIVSLLIIVLITVPAAVILKNSASEARYAYLRTKQTIQTGNILDIDCTSKDNFICRTSDYIRDAFQDPDLKFYVEGMVSKVTTFVIEKTSSILFSIPRFLLNIFITFFIAFYLLKDGERMIAKIKRLIPLKQRHQEHIFKKIHDVTHAVIYGSIVIALIQGALGALGFFVVGISSPLVWGSIMALLALIPFIGTGIIWVPAALYLIVIGVVQGDSLMIIKGVGLFIYGALIVGGIDNILKPKIIGQRGGVHPILVLLGVFGGIALFGLIGFFVGPLILVLLKAFIDIHEKERVAH